MYRIILFTMLAFIFTSSFLIISTSLEDRKVYSEDVLASSSIDPFEESVFGVMNKPKYYSPKRLTTMAQRVPESFEIMEVVLDPYGQLEVPDWNLAGWYSSSARPGEGGNVVINGHYDREDGFPAAFWGLKNLKVDDTVILQDELRRNFAYVVVDIFYVDIQDPQRTKVFEDTGEPELTLITCGGVWNPAEGTYTKRLVVKAKLVSTESS